MFSVVGPQWIFILLLLLLLFRGGLPNCDEFVEIVICMAIITEIAILRVYFSLRNHIVQKRMSKNFAKFASFYHDLHTENLSEILIIDNIYGIRFGMDFMKWNLIQAIAKCLNLEERISILQKISIRLSISDFFWFQIF